MVKHHLSAFEPRSFCDVCSTAITNPICPNCLILEIEAWLTFYPNLKKELLQRIKKYIDEREEKLSGFLRCIKCKSMDISICPYCFTDRILKELKKLEANKIIIKEFFEFFNFDFEHSGYSKEAENLGLI